LVVAGGRSIAYLKENEVNSVRRGEIHLVYFDPTVGREIQKTRPALVIQNDIGNRFSSLTIVAAITSTISPVPYPVEVAVPPSRASGLSVLSAIRLDQIRTVDKQRLIKRLGVLAPSVMEKVDQSIRISLGLTGI
jgi:mRNA interferase MazF